jgi:uncharacterized protein YndB with AHSA1/START domain
MINQGGFLTMRHAFLAAAATVCLLAAAPAQADPAKYPDVTDSSFAMPNGQKTLQESVVIKAPVAILWKAFADTEEFKRWNSPVASIDLRVGGTLEASYDPKHAIGDPDNIRHRIITYLPERLLVFQNIQAPHELPNADKFQKTVIVLQYEVLGPNETRVTISCTGFDTDAASMQIYAFFQEDNAEELEKMKQVYEAKG